MLKGRDNSKSYLIVGVSAPDLVIIKNFVHFYIYSSTGRLSATSVIILVLNFAERFISGFQRITKTEFNPSDTSDVYYISEAASIGKEPRRYIERETY
jgi:hypothetical protein